MKEGSDWFSKFFTIVLPIGLAVSVVLGVWLHVAKREKDELSVETRQPRILSRAELQDIEQKINELIGPRGIATEEERKNLQATRSFIAGSLSPENAGYVLFDGPGVASEGQLFKPLWVDLTGRKKREVLRIMTRIDGGEDGAARTAVVLGLAQAMAAETPSQTVRFMFLTGLEDRVTGLAHKNSERYQGILWVGEGGPDELGVQHVAVDPADSFSSALKVREVLDGMLRR